MLIILCSTFDRGRGIDPTLSKVVIGLVCPGPLHPVCVHLAGMDSSGHESGRLGALYLYPNRGS